MWSLVGHPQAQECPTRTGYLLSDRAHAAEDAVGERGVADHVVVLIPVAHERVEVLAGRGVDHLAQDVALGRPS